MSELQLEVGKSYVNRLGEIVKIVSNDEHHAYPFGGDDGSSYKPNGVILKGELSDKDLISEAQPEDDAVNHPTHYTSHPSGIECIQVTEHMGFCIGRAIEYLCQAGLKHDSVEDMRNAIWYIEREIERRQNDHILD